MKILMFTMSFLLLPMLASANIVCEGETDYGPLRVEIASSTAVVSGAGLSTPRRFSHLSMENGLITAPGLSLTYSNDFGCIRDVTIVTDLREPIGAGFMRSVFVQTCSGGETPDEICFQ